MASNCEQTHAADFKPFRFFDLPYDIRYLVYQTMKVAPAGPNTAWQWERDDFWDIDALEEASPRLALELEVALKRCLLMEGEQLEQRSSEVEAWVNEGRRHRLKDWRWLELTLRHPLECRIYVPDWDQPPQVLRRLWHDYLNPQHITVEIPWLEDCRCLDRRSWRWCRRWYGCVHKTLSSFSDTWADFLDTLKLYSTAASITFLVRGLHGSTGRKIEDTVRAFAADQGFSMELEPAQRCYILYHWKLRNNNGEEGWARAQIEAEEYWKGRKNRGEETRWNMPETEDDTEQLPEPAHQ